MCADVAFFFSGNFRGVSEFYVPTFRTLCFIFIGGVRKKNKVKAWNQEYNYIHLLCS